MEENKQRLRLSIFSDIIIFLILLNIFTFGFTYLKISTSSNLGNLLLSETKISGKNKIEIENIKKTYNVDIVYGESTIDLANMVQGNIQINDDIINKQIDIIDSSLSKYPTSFFGKKITVILLDSFNNDNIALACRNNLNEFKIYLSNTEKIERSFHHEMYHVFEYCYKDKLSFDDWEELNPTNFTYINDLQKLDYRYVYDNDENIFFVTRYSKTSEKEDRAEIFSDIMIAKNKPKYLDYSNSLKDKVDYLKVSLSNNYSNKSNLFWNRF